jgi:hypothetical protein
LTPQPALLTENSVRMDNIIHKEGDSSYPILGHLLSLLGHREKGGKATLDGNTKKL